ncbi:hypothetical protein [Mycolicibacterium sp. 120270]|uniref:hypothetical protein n=1 Tax=Mycolicibacterium sp. 120270 TaxID=3090600 RepID=UPI00299F30FA|nr:hypothetical protein [Mycolicibacterium sp. 120270]MDX1883621.1 hypothetical protein [Mycolicibacterium sp. 120270]
MDKSIVLALIAAVAGLLSSVWTMRRQHQSSQALAELNHRFDLQIRSDERQYAALEQLDKFREPLIAAAEGLWHRIHNLRTKGFGTIYFDMPGDERRSRMAMLGTLYRFGRYWSIVEQLAQSVNQLRFETENETKGVAKLLDDIRNAFSSDAPHRGGRSLMVWREEQRGIAELMRSGESSETLATIGFATFVQIYDSRLSEWFADMETGLRTTDLESHARLAELQDLLYQLKETLKQGRRLTLAGR